MEVELGQGFTAPELAIVPPAKSKLPMVLASVVGVLVLAVVGYIAMGHPAQTEAPPIVEPPAKVDPVVKGIREGRRSWPPRKRRAGRRTTCCASSSSRRKDIQKATSDAGRKEA